MSEEDVICDFHTTAHEFLSNFYPVNILWDGITYPSVEHAYVAGKTTDLMLRKQVCEIPTAGNVKRFGRTLKVRENWDIVRLPLMETLLSIKFQNLKLREMLDATGNKEIIEGNWWGDVFWGKCKGVGQNNLGKILMRIREQNRGSCV